METKPQSNLNPEENNSVQEQNSNPSSEMTENIETLPFEGMENPVSEEALTEEVDPIESTSEVSAEPENQAPADESAEPEVDQAIDAPELAAEEAPEIVEEVIEPVAEAAQAEIAEA